MEPTIFTYHDPIEFLNASIQSIQKKNPSFSLRAFSKQLGMSHVAMLSMVLNRKRKLLPNLSSKISYQFKTLKKFNEDEARYFDMLVLFHNATTIDEKNFYEGILSNLKPDKNFSTLELDKINIISEWYHTAILEMTYLKNFSSDPNDICKKLGDNVSVEQVRTAIERLLRLGLLEKNKKGILKKSNTYLATPSGIPNKGLKKFHTELLTKAIKAIENQTVDERDITSYTMTIDTKKIPEAKKMITLFRRKLAAFLETPNGDSVYQLNIQLFDLLGDSDDQ